MAEPARRWHRSLPVENAPRRHLQLVPHPPPAREAACCVAQRDELGRLPVGWCGPECIRRRR